MATFSPLPNVPDAPSYLGYSRGVDAGSADTSTGQLFGQTASLVKEVTGAVDDLFKKEADQGVREAVERVQSQQGVPEAVETVKSGQGIFRKPGMVNDDGTAIATPDGADPGFVRQVDKSASDMTSQRDAYYAGKRSQSYYLASLEAESRRLTAQNPAYADYIQERFGAIAGVKPANALVASLRADLDAADRANKSAENSYEKWLQKPDTMKHLSAENYGLAVRKEISPGRLQQMIQVSVAHEYNLDRLAKEQSTNKGTREAVESETEKGVMIGETGHFQKELSGLYENPRYVALMKKMEKGTLSPDEKAEAIKVANVWAANTVNRWSSSLTQVRHDPTVPPGSQESAPEYAIYQQLGNTKFQESLKRMEERVKGFMDNINNPQTGLAKQDELNYKLRLDDEKLRLSKIPGMMTPITLGEMGEYGKILSAELLKTNLDISVDQTTVIANRIRQQKLKETPKAAFNPQDPETKVGTNEVYDAVTVQKRTGLSELDQKRTLKRMLEDNPKDLAAPNLSDKERVNLFQYSFGDKSNRVVSDMMATPAQKQKMFQMYADPKVTANAEKIKESNPELYQQYRDYIDTRAKEYYSEDGLSMKRFLERKELPVKIEFSAESKRFITTRVDRRSGGLVPGVDLKVQETVNNMNSMLRVVEPTIDGGKPTAGRLLEYMKSVYGIDFNPQKGVPAAPTPELPPLRPGVIGLPGTKRSDLGNPIDLDAQAGATRLVQLIDKHEGQGSYNTLYGGGRAPITDMTVDDILGFQGDRKSKTGNPAEPVGRYQIIGSTLKSLKTELGLTGTEKMTPDLQDKMFDTLLDRRGLSKYVAGDLSKKQFAANLRKEWDGFKNVSDAQLFYAIDEFAVTRHAKMAEDSSNG